MYMLAAILLVQWRRPGTHYTYSFLGLQTTHVYKASKQCETSSSFQAAVYHCPSAGTNKVWTSCHKHSCTTTGGETHDLSITGSMAHLPGHHATMRNSQHMKKNNLAFSNTATHQCCKSTYHATHTNSTQTALSIQVYITQCIILTRD